MLISWYLDGIHVVQAVAWQTGTHRQTRDAWAEGSTHNTSTSSAKQTDADDDNRNCNNNNGACS